MKKIVLALISLFFVTNSFGQMGITEHLDTLKFKYPNGIIQTDSDSITFYVVESSYLNSYLFFNLNEDKYCVATVVKPYTERSYKEWVKTMNVEWNRDNNKRWSLVRSDGLNFLCSLEKDIYGEKILFFYIKN